MSGIRAAHQGGDRRARDDAARGPAGKVSGMSSKDEVEGRHENGEPRASGDMAEAGADQSEDIETVWKPPERSDQAPGEETVQVNDAYAGGDRPDADEPPAGDDQHPTGG